MFGSHLNPNATKVTGRTTKARSNGGRMLIRSPSNFVNVPEIIEMRLTRGAGRRIPARRVGKLLVIRRGDVRTCGIHGIFDFGRDRNPLIAVRQRIQIVVLRHSGAIAVRCAILSYVTRAKLSGHNFQVPLTCGGRSASSASTCAGGREFPLGNRIALPRRLWGSRRGPAEMKKARLRSRIDVDAK